jgi:hypothetical protein
MAVENSNENDNIFQTIWKRMDTLEAAGLKNEFAEHPPLMSRGGGFKRFVIIMVVGMAYKWYRARFINKVCFKKQVKKVFLFMNALRSEPMLIDVCRPFRFRSGRNNPNGTW